MMKQTIQSFKNVLRRLIKEAEALSIDGHPAFQAMVVNVSQRNGLFGAHQALTPIKRFLERVRQWQSATRLWPVPFTTPPVTPAGAVEFGSVLGPLSVALWINAVILSKCCAVFGLPGAGKTSFLLELIDRLLACNPGQYRIYAIESNKGDLLHLRQKYGERALIIEMHQHGLFHLLSFSPRIPFLRSLAVFLENIQCFTVMGDPSIRIIRESCILLHQRQGTFSLDELLTFLKKEAMTAIEIGKPAYRQTALDKVSLLRSYFPASADIRQGITFEDLERYEVVVFACSMQPRWQGFFTALVAGNLLEYHVATQRRVGRTQEVTILVADECSAILDKRLYSPSAQSSLERYVQQSRELALSGVFLAHDPSAVLPVLLGAATTLGLRLQSAAARKTLAHAQGLQDSNHYLTLHTHEAVLACNDLYPTPLHIQLHHLHEPLKGVLLQDVAAEVDEEISQIPITRYQPEPPEQQTMPKKAPDPQPSAGTPPEQPTPPAPDVIKEPGPAVALLHRRRHHYLERITDSYTALGLSAGTGARATQTLLNQGWAEQVSISTGKRGGKRRLLLITQEGATRFGAAYKPLPGKSALETRVWMQFARRYLEAQGYTQVRLEAQLPGSSKQADLVATDVHGRIVAVELELSSKVTGTLRNAEADLQCADLVRFYFKTKRKLENHKAILASIPVGHHHKLSFHLLHELLETRSTAGAP